jgi:ABC-type multidrug transport system permease subunit
MSAAARFAISDTLVLALRALRRIPRNPELLTAYTVQPIMFTLLFVAVFGGAIQTPGYDGYADFMIPGIIVQQMSFGGFATALGLVDDLKKGLVDRFRSLPMSRMAVLTGRTLSDIAMNALALAVMIGASSAFVPPETMPDWLRTFATDINPFSTMVDAVRALFVGGPAGNDIWGSVAWCSGLIAVFGSLAVRRYRTAVLS